MISEAVLKFTVSQFVAVFNQSLELMYPSVVISGEIANFRISKGAWVYFDLKDESSSVKFFGSVRSLPGPLEDGINVEAVGLPRLHNLYGFSVNFTEIAVVGEGSIAKAQALLASKLEREGLFALERKREIPFAPDRIGLITSGESAAYSDFIKIINSRWGKIEIQFRDCLVQGNEAAGQIISAIEKFNLAPDPPEILVLIRGGGSADDLAVFSLENVVRAVSTSRIPTLVAIGHERDVSLSELAADKRASTPSNAAELLVPDQTHERQILAGKNQQVDSWIKQIFDKNREELNEIWDYVTNKMNTKVEQQKTHLQQKGLMLEALNPSLPFKKGFALVRDKSGKQIKNASFAKKAVHVSMEFGDGTVNAEVVNGS